MIHEPAAEMSGNTRVVNGMGCRMTERVHNAICRKGRSTEGGVEKAEDGCGGPNMTTSDASL